MTAALRLVYARQPGFTTPLRAPRKYRHIKSVSSRGYPPFGSSQASGSMIPNQANQLRLQRSNHDQTDEVLADFQRVHGDPFAFSLGPQTWHIVGSQAFFRCPGYEDISTSKSRSFYCGYGRSLGRNRAQLRRQTMCGKRT